MDPETKTLLLQKVELLLKTTRRLKPTRRRRWDTLGRAWKWMAGSPDADDLTTINNELENLTDNSNKQITINNDLRDNVENLTGALNTLIAVETQNSKISIIRNNIIKAILTLDTLKEEIDGIQTAVTLSKLNIVNSKILSPTEIDLIHKTLVDQGIRSESMESAFHLISTTVGVSNHFLAYILNLPDLDPNTFDNIRIEAIIADSKRIKLKSSNLLKSEARMFSVKTAGKTFGNWSFFKLNQLEDLSTDKCLPNLMKGHESSCVYETTVIHEPLVEMTPSTIFANSVNATLETSCGVSDRRLTGSFLITFENCSISILNRTFTNELIGSVTQPLFVPSAHLKVTQEALEEIINIHSLHLQSRQNLKALHHLNLKTSSHKWTMIGGFSFSTTVILTLVLYICLKSRNRQIIEIQRTVSKTPPPAPSSASSTKSNRQQLFYRPPALRDRIPV